MFPFQGRLALVSLKGGEMDTLMQVIEIVLCGLVDNKDMAAWQLHVDILVMLLCDTHSQHYLVELQHLIAMSPTMMRLDSSNQPDDDEVHGASATPSDVAMERTLNLLNIPNFKTISHVPEQISFLGPMWFQDTILYEQ
jgi:hypothetical protein